MQTSNLFNVGKTITHERNQALEQNDFWRFGGLDFKISQLSNTNSDEAIILINLMM